LIIGTIIAGQVGLNEAGQLITTGLAAISMGCQMTANSILQVPLLPVPLATGTINTMFTDNPLKPSKIEKTLRKGSLLLALILGSAAGTGLALIRPWVALLFPCCSITGIHLYLLFITRRKVNDI